MWTSSPFTQREASLRSSDLPGGGEPKHIGSKEEGCSAGIDAI